MFLYAFLVTLYIILCFVLVAAIMLQKSKGSVAPLHVGGVTQMIFGGSGGQDFFQKVTWLLGLIFMFGSLIIAVMRTHDTTVFSYISAQKSAPVASMAQDALPQDVVEKEPVKPVQDSTQEIPLE